MTKYKHEDNVQLKRLIEPALVGAIQLVLGSEQVHVVRSSNIMHTELSPTGDSFTINVVIEVQPKPAKQKEKDGT
jgi:hypothetical protein